jgi:hypothetical protein
MMKRLDEQNPEGLPITRPTVRAVDLLECRNRLSEALRLVKAIREVIGPD